MISMRKFLSILMSILLVCAISGCGPSEQDTPAANSQDQRPETGTAPNQQEAETPAPADTQDQQILIAYFSVPEDVDTTGVDAVSGASIVVSDGEKLGNTQYVAELIQDAIGGDLFRIETVAPYPLDHEPLVDQASEEKAAAVRPELSAQVENFEQYDVVLLGYPNWWADLPMPVYSFLESYDFSTKTIIPFITHGGSRASRTVETISELQPDATVYDHALVLSRNDVANSGDDVTAWITSVFTNS